MLNSEIKKVNGIPTLFVNGESIPACAYITYLPERNCYADFTKEGYRVFSVNAAFSSLPANSTTGCELMEAIFKNPNEPDYSAFDAEMAELLEVCPNAYVFPRIYVTMPRKWVAEHPEDSFDAPDGNRREVLFSEAFRKDGGEMLKQFIRHVQNSDYAEHIIGYQVSGGQTQEWFHFSGQYRIEQVKAGIETMHMEHTWKELYYANALPDMSEFAGTGALQDVCIKQYLEFLNYSVADTVSYFARLAKEATERKQIIGTFYGYTLEVVDPTWGTHAMERLLDCPDIDFFCSPVSYTNTRKLGIDWGNMVAEKSIQLHGKMYFAECDIRTNLTDYPGACRADFDPEGKYRGPIWKGPDSVELSLAAMRKAYARQLIHQSGLWWFDMWGGWYANPIFMEEVKKCLEFMTQDVATSKCLKRAEVALFVDETLYRRIGAGEACKHAQYVIRTSLGQSGAPYDTYLLCDAKECINYRAVILPVAFDSDETLALKELCLQYQIPVLQATPDHWRFSPEELRAFYEQSNVWCYCDSNDVFGMGNGYFYIHAAESGVKEIRFPQAYTVQNLCNDAVEAETTDVIRVSMQQYETLIFHIM